MNIYIGRETTVVLINNLDANNVVQDGIKILIAHGKTMFSQIGLQRQVITLANTVPTAIIKTRMLEQAVKHVVLVHIQVGQVQAAVTVLKVNITTKTHKALVVATIATQVTMEIKMDSRTAKHVLKVIIQVRELGAAVAALRGNITTKPDKALVVVTIALPGVMEAKVLEHPVRVMGIVMLGNIPLQA